MLKTSMKCEVGEPCEAERERMSRRPYRELVGSLMYLSTMTRPDISYALSSCSRHCHNPRDGHWSAAKKILAYLKGTRDTKLILGGAGEWNLHGYADANFGVEENRRSQTGYVFYIGCEGPVSWSSRVQKTIAQSTAEAEYMAAGEGAKEGVWLRNLLQELHLMSKDLPFTLCSDNQAAQEWISNARVAPKTKHIAIRHHWIREIVKQGIMVIKDCPTRLMRADVLTKSMCNAEYAKKRDLCMRLDRGMTTINHDPE